MLSSSIRNNLFDTILQFRELLITQNTTKIEIPVSYKNFHFLYLLFAWLPGCILCFRCFCWTSTVSDKLNWTDSPSWWFNAIHLRSLPRFPSYLTIFIISSYTGNNDQLRWNPPPSSNFTKKNCLFDIAYFPTSPSPKAILQLQKAPPSSEQILILFPEWSFSMYLW